MVEASGPAAEYRRRLDAGALRPDPAQAAAVERLDELHRQLGRLGAGSAASGLLGRLGLVKDQPLPKGLYFHGGVGRGKSVLMDLFFAGAPIANKRRVHFHAFMQEVHRRVFEWRHAPQDARETDDPLKPLALRLVGEARLLCFDELDVTDITDAMILGRLFRKMWEKGVVVVSTSNRRPDELYKGGLNRELFLPFIDLLRSNMEVVEIDGGSDYRLRRGRGMQTLFTPLDDAAASGIAATFAELTDGARIEAHALEVMGRQLEVPEAANGVARFDFDRLCRRALGAGDYLAIAKAYRALVLEGVPVLTAEMRNEARRLVLLIDALYERRAKLVMSAAAAIEALYAEGDHAFEFRRAASRLAEMQSADYLALPHLPD
ncbi:MAG: AFG1 family ATPase [Alphaproteobacteria bacterium]|nr:AFG1 family ATPase [Alphaproteobacteria bacterium]